MNYREDPGSAPDTEIRRESAEAEENDEFSFGL